MDSSRLGSRATWAKACLWLGGALSSAIIPLSACGGSPAQIIEYSPLRGSIGVSTAEPVRISFDHDVDQASVASRFHLIPATAGDVRWLNRRQLVYHHPTLRTNTTYQVVIEAGYRDVAGNVYTLRHHWSFVTELPPSLVGSTPASQDAGVDPAAYLTLDFTRQMDPVSLRSALSLNPSTAFDVRLDPADGRRAIIAPAELLAPNSSYQLSIEIAATDADGNQLDRDQSIAFTTGNARALRHWIAFSTQNADQSPGALWIVDDSGFPRQLYGTSPVHSFSWSPSGDRLIVQGDGDTWSVLTPGVGVAPLTFTAPWAGALAAGMGYVYIDEGGTLRRRGADGKDEAIATDVAQASVGPNGLRVAFISPSSPDEIWGYDVGLRARYQLALDTGPVSDVAWAPAGNRIAYLRHDLSTLRLRVRTFSSAGLTVTVASGDIAAPTWMPDSNSVVFAAALTPGAAQHKALVVSVAAPPAPINPEAAGLPSAPGIDVQSPAPSPDGHQIAFLNAGQIWLMNADGTRPTALTRPDPSSFPYSCLTPAWTRS
ncbi:MAG TPA: Ig-like domain-containing protein [Candidatus Dormibacteraeota bacterium]|nr:Ig-like domain-containing protein [Candidatus Dormibacteraeota bacterium]